MPNIEQGLHLLVDHHRKIESEEVADAFFYLVGHGLSLPGWRCTAVQKGFIPDFRYYLGNKMPYAFIVNEYSLLFYLRKAGMEMLKTRAEELRKKFDDVSDTARGEVKVRINNIDEAKKLVKFLFN
jgi:hypothetical protein